MSQTAGQSVGISSEKKVFWTCFIALITTAFSFMLRVMLMDEWTTTFQLTKTQAGTIFGAGFWPFGVSIVLFSLVIDRIGYGKAMAFAFVSHLGFAALTITAGFFPEERDLAFRLLYWGSVIGALGNGTVEAVINPVIATVFKNDKTKWLNYLHAGWPGGLVVTGIVVLLLPESITWQTKIGLIILPTLVYGVMMLGSRFPVSERVTAGVSHREMLNEMGWAGAFIVFLMISMELTANVLGIDMLKGFGWQVGLAVVGTLIFAYYARSFGRPMFVFLLLVMLLLATTELGTDAWIKDLMGPAIESAFQIDSGWVLVYTATIMLLLRSFCGPIVENLKPLGLLAASSAIVAIGIFSLSALSRDADSSAVIIFVAATLYGVGQSFFWPTTLGVVAEQFPRGGAMTLNVIAGVGMLGVGVLGNPWLGNVQDKEVTAALLEKDPAIHTKYVTTPKQSLFGEYVALNATAAGDAPESDRVVIEAAERDGKSAALRTVTILPLLMLGSYIGLILYFRSRGGYRPVDILHKPESDGAS